MDAERAVSALIEYSPLLSDRDLLDRGTVIESGRDVRCAT